MSEAPNIFESIYPDFNNIHNKSLLGLKTEIVSRHQVNIFQLLNPSLTNFNVFLSNVVVDIIKSININF